LAGVIAYALMLSAAVAIFLLIRAWGDSWTDASISATPAAELSPRAASHGERPLACAACSVAIIIVGRGSGLAFSPVGPAPVIGEVVAGILLDRRCWDTFADAMTILSPPT